MQQPSVLRIAAKETATFFASPVAFIFFGAFLLIALFMFFWVDTFFARNIADVRPLFDWMPVLLIFLVAALTMRMWSEERRSGTLEFLLTQPVSPLRFVIGKFLACLALVAIALALTLPLPITVSFLGDLDWGPVLGGYLAALILASAYIAIGLTVSAKSDSQIVSLIVTVLVCSVLYLIGSEPLTSLMGYRAAELLESLGTGSRFSAITRGVLDLRDLYYYLSIIGVFISLNVYFLESGRWATETGKPAHRRWRTLTALLAANFIAGNLWLSQVGWARADVTEGRLYSISDATRGYLSQLREPLLIRGYFSAKTHPLLAPLVPRLRDLILEYEVAGKGKVRAEFIDPLENPELEEEAASKYNIKPVPFQVADKYSASLVNSYFDILIQYGDQYEVLGFRDLIEVKSQTEADLDVELRNPEYELTRGIKKVLYEYQSGGDLFASLGRTVTFTAYVSPDAKLPPVLVDFKKEMTDVLDELKKSAAGRFDYRQVDPEQEGGSVAREIAENFGFQPMQASLFDSNSFYYYMTVTDGEQIMQVPLPEDLMRESLRSGIEAALQRFSTGFMKTVALYTPPEQYPDPAMAQFRMPSGRRFDLLQEVLRENHRVKNVGLDKGFVPEDADILVLAAPDKLDDRQLYAVDQFLMKGGTVVASAAPFEAQLGSGTLQASKHETGLEEWLKHHGITLEQSMVLDPQNAMLPIPVSRDLGGFAVQEIRMVEYPYFVDVRGTGLTGGAMTSALPQVTMTWSSPITVDEAKNKGRKVTPLLKSSGKAWTSDSPDVLPDFAAHGPLGFDAAPERKARTLAVAVEGRFDSFFKDKESPLLKVKENAEPKGEGDAEEPQTVISGTIEKSPESARIILFASNDFLTDQTIRLAASAGGTEYLNSLELMANAVDWSLEDRGLLSIRSRGHFARTLVPLTEGARTFWEYLNYFLALAGLFVVYLVHRSRRAKTLRHYQELLQENGGNA